MGLAKHSKEPWPTIDNIKFSQALITYHSFLESGEREAGFGLLLCINLHNKFQFRKADPAPSPPLIL